MSKHTTGPWEIEEPATGYLRVYGAPDGDADEYGRARFYREHVCDVIDNQQEQENAALIGAAPDLLRELIAARVVLEAIENHCKNEAGLRGIDHADEGRRIRHGLQLLLAEPSPAIAKATSAQPNGAGNES